MKIRITADYRGHLTQEQFYRAGVYEVDVEIPVDVAAALVRAGRAVEVEAVRAAADNPARGGRKRGGDL